MSNSPRIVLATLNARYIHASLGLRYLLANMARHGGDDLRAATVLREYTLTRPIAQVVEDLVSTLGPVGLPEPRTDTFANASGSLGGSGFCAGQGGARAAGGGHGAKPTAAQTPSECQASDAPIVGFGVYIWNVVQTTEVIRQLKALRPDVRVVLGGPEVSHELDGQPIVALADYVITGWGDVSFPKLCRALIHGPRPLMKVIAGEQPPLDQIELPYAEFSDDDLAHRLLYVEASRGCPFKCEFCLSALDKTAWAFDEDVFLAELATLYARGARNFKFVDRTFNLKIDASIRILQFFLDRLKPGAWAAERSAQVKEERPKGAGDTEQDALPPKLQDTNAPLFIHFEVVPDHLPDRLKDAIAQFPPGVLQFEIGIQSFDVDVQQRISRRQDNTKTQANLRWLLDHSQAHLHTDLIFGLPGESWQSFAQGFDRLYAIGPHEIQLGVLKRLRGTPLANRSLPGAVAEHGMVYEVAPPYTVQSNDAVGAVEVQAFIRLARYWDLVANSGRFGVTLRLVMQGGMTSGLPFSSEALDSPFAAFAQLSQWLWHTSAITRGKTSGLSPEDWVDALFEYLTTQRGLKSDDVRAALVVDYVGSGARANPRSLQGFLPVRAAPQPGGRRALAQRQSRHQKSALADTPAAT